MTRYAARVDDNHAAIRSVFETMLAGNVTDTSRFGGGAGDLFVSYGAYGAWVEIKRDAAAKLTPDQERFHRLHPGCTFRVNDVAQAENVARIVRARGMALSGATISASCAERAPSKLSAELREALDSAHGIYPIPGLPR